MTTAALPRRRRVYFWNSTQALTEAFAELEEAVSRADHCAIQDFLASIEYRCLPGTPGTVTAEWTNNYSDVSNSSSVS